MNFGIGGTHSVILMSLRANAPYDDRVEADGAVPIYESHDEPRTAELEDPNRVDQPRTTKNGRLTQNGQFEVAALRFKAGERSPEKVRVYKKVPQASGPTTVCSTLWTRERSNPSTDWSPYSASKLLKVKRTCSTRFQHGRKDDESRASIRRTQAECMYARH